MHQLQNVAAELVAEGKDFLQTKAVPYSRNSCKQLALTVINVGYLFIAFPGESVRNISKAFLELVSRSFPQMRKLKILFVVVTQVMAMLIPLQHQYQM